VKGIAGVVLTETDDPVDSFFTSGCTSCVARVTVRFISNVHIVVYTSVQVYSVDIEVEQWVPLALLSNYKIFRTAVNNKNK
jgi:hypothetical protein